MDALDRVTDEFRRLDDELSAAVELPSVDDVIRRAGSLTRASTAAAAAVITVGALGGFTAVTQLALDITPQIAPAASPATDAVPSLPAEGEAPIEALPTAEEQAAPGAVVDDPVGQAPGRRLPTATTTLTPVAPAPGEQPTTTPAPGEPTTSPNPQPGGGSEGTGGQTTEPTTEPPPTTDPEPTAENPGPPVVIPTSTASGPATTTADTEPAPSGGAEGGGGAGPDGDGDGAEGEGTGPADDEAGLLSILI